MKLKDTFITQEFDGEQIMVSSENSIFIRSNKTAAFIINCLKQDTTKEAIIEAFLERYNVSTKIAKESVENILCKLRSINALDE